MELLTDLKSEKNNKHFEKPVMLGLRVPTVGKFMACLMRIYVC